MIDGRRMQPDAPLPLKFRMKIFFKALRVVLGPLVLLREALTRPTGIERPAALQAQVALACQSLSLYHYKTCPFCSKVRQEMRRLSLPIRCVDAQPDGPDRQALLQEGGLAKAPCLRITDAAGQSQWLYDSKKISAYLRERFAGAAPT